MENIKNILSSTIKIKKISLILLFLFTLSSCNSSSINNDQFDADNAYNFIKEQISYGPRYPGTIGHENTQKLIRNTLEKNDWLVEVQSTEYDGFPVTNIIGKKGEGDPWIILGAHYDTRQYADQNIDENKRHEPVIGANDGGSGVGILLELSRVLDNITDKTIWLVFFDQEDNGGIDGRDWILGSRAFVHALNGNPDMVVIVDMVGDSDLNLYYERNSDPNIMENIWLNAAELGFSDNFISQYKYSMLDDHTPFIQAGIPAIDIIDFDYPYWHTSEDTIDKISKKSLEVVGSTILKWINSIGH